MNNEPVAWLNYKGYLIDDDDVQRYKDEGFVMTPLYTHPAKTLTDEEIMEVWRTEFDDAYLEESVLPNFARAILKKASEPKTYKPKIVDMVLRTDNQGNVLPQKEIKESE